MRSSFSVFHARQQVLASGLTLKPLLVSYKLQYERLCAEAPVEIDFRNDMYCVQQFRGHNAA